MPDQSIVTERVQDIVSDPQNACVDRAAPIDVDQTEPIGKRLRSNALLPGLVMGRIRDWAKCLDCGERRMVSHKEWIRASRPRCRACGGPVEPSDAAADEHASHYEAEKVDQHRRDVKTNRINKPR